MSDKAIDFVGQPDVLLAAEEVRQRVDDLNRAFEHAARMGIGVNLNIFFATYDNPSKEVPNKAVIQVTALYLTKLI